MGDAIAEAFRLIAVGLGMVLMLIALTVIGALMALRGTQGIARHV